MKLLRNGAIALAFAAVVFIPSANAQTTTSLEDMLAQIQELMELIENLQMQLNEARSEVKNLIQEGLEEGMTSDDIREIQEILASDPTIYPEGLTTGYFGPLTRAALQRFQAKFKLEVNGQIDEETRAALETLLQERFGEGKVPPGLLHAPGIQKKFELRLREGCDNSGPGKAPFCKKVRVKYNLEDDDDDDDDANDDDDDANDDDDDANDDDDDANDDDDTTDFDVEVEIEDDTTTIDFTYDDEDYSVEVESTDIDDVLEAIADELDMDVEDLDEDLVDEITEELDQAVEDAAQAEDDAQDAIDEAQSAIDDAQDAIDSSANDTTDAEAKLAEAQDKLDDAQDAFDAGDFEDAEDLAGEAESLAEDAEDLT